MEDSEGFGIYAMTFDASGQTTGATLLTGGGQCPVVSPGGTKIAFLSSRDGEGMGLWVMRAAPEGSANPRQTRRWHALGRLRLLPNPRLVPGREEDRLHPQPKIPRRNLEALQHLGDERRRHG